MASLRSAVTKSFATAEGVVFPNPLPVISRRSGTKNRAGTNAGTDSPLVLNEMSDVPAFTPIFMRWFYPAVSIRGYPCELRQNGFVVALGFGFGFANYELPVTNCRPVPACRGRPRRAVGCFPDYVTKTESETVSETKISNDSNTMHGKTESDPIFSLRRIFTCVHQRESAAKWF